MSRNDQALLIAGSRTPIGSYGRSLRRLTADKLAGHAFTSAIQRAGICVDQIDGIYLGHAFQFAFPNTARFVAVNIGLPATIPAMTVQRQCASGMESANLAMDQIHVGKGDLYLVGGVESMSTVPYVVGHKLRYTAISKRIPRYAPQPYIGIVDDGLAPTDRIFDLNTTYMSGTAERLAQAYGVSRQEADEYSLRSQELAAKAIKSGRFIAEIDPVMVPGRGFFSQDEHPRKTSIEKLSALKPVLKTKTITAGNSSGINDGACAMIIASSTKAKALGLEPLAVLVDSQVVGVDPKQMGIGPVVAIEKLLKRNNLTLKDIDYIEINEAFAAQYLTCEKLLGLDRNKVNLNGGAIALGHPIAMTGSRLIITVAQELKNRGLKRGIAALCVGGGMGIATLIESPSI